MDRLNGSACWYLNEKPVEKEFAKYGEQISAKLDSFVVDLERELTHTLTKSYPRNKSVEQVGFSLCF
jgi:hypothetical protein